MFGASVLDMKLSPHFLCITQYYCIEKTSDPLCTNAAAKAHHIQEMRYKIQARMNEEFTPAID